MAIHNDQVAALLKNDFDRVTELKGKIQVAREYKASAVELYREHIISQGC